MIRGSAFPDIADIWRYRNLDVFYRSDLDGDGRNQAPSFIRHIRKRYGSSARFANAFEWCAGPGFIGFSLLAEGLIGHLSLGDINPEAIEFAMKTVHANDLHSRVSLYVSDNMKSIPIQNKFDLVVGNPPTFFSIESTHHDYQFLAGDPRANDPGWEIHRDFYSSIGRHLRPAAKVLVQEVEPYDTLISMPAGSLMLWDTRPEPPIQTFTDMIATGGLSFEGAEIFHVDPKYGNRHWMLTSSASP